MTLAGVGPSILAAAGSECLAFAVSQSCLLQTALVMWIIHGSINRAYFDCITYDNECEVDMRWTPGVSKSSSSFRLGGCPDHIYACRWVR